MAQQPDRPEQPEQPDQPEPEQPDQPDQDQPGEVDERAIERTGCFTVGWIIIVLVLLLLLGVAVGLFFWRPARSDLEHPGVGEALPALQLQPLTGGGQPVTLEDVRGEVVLLHFWGTWCPPCIEELPRIIGVAATFKQQEDFRFLSVSSSRRARENIPELRRQTERFLERADLRMTTYADQDAVTRRAAVVQYLRTTLVLDRRGVIRGAWAGYIPGAEKEMKRTVAELLEEGNEPAGKEE